MKLQIIFIASAAADLISWNRLFNNIENHRKYNKGHIDDILLQYVDFMCCKQDRQILHLSGGTRLHCTDYTSHVVGMPFSACFGQLNQ